MVLAAYIAGFSFILESETDHLSIQNFEDLVKQRQLEFGTMEGSSTLQYFKVGQSDPHPPGSDVDVCVSPFLATGITQIPLSS